MADDINVRLAYKFSPGMVPLPINVLNKTPRSAIEAREGHGLTPRHCTPSVDPEVRGQELGVGKHCLTHAVAVPAIMAQLQYGVKCHGNHHQQYMVCMMFQIRLTSQVIFSFPRREFGKSAPVKRSFQASWFNRWKWLHYDVAQDAAYCFTCCKALEVGKIRLSACTEESFVVELASIKV